MNLVIYSWNGYQINDWWWNNQVGDYSAEFPVGERGNITTTPVYSDRAYSFPKLSTAQTGGYQISFVIQLKSVNPTHTVATLREQLKQYFQIGVDFNPHQLIAQDVEDSNKQWYLSGIITNFQETAISQYTVTLSTDDPIWRVVTSSTSGNIAVTSSPNTQNLTLKGNVPAQPVITITANSGRTGSYLYRRYILAYNTTANSFPVNNAALDITNGGLNTSALISGGKMQSAGQDIRVIVDGAQRNFWIGGGGINTTTTLIWANLSWSIGQSGTISTSLPNNGTAVTVAFNQNATSLSLLQTLANAVNSAFIIDSEVFTFSKANVDLVNYQITSCSRAQKGTSFAAHSANATAYWIEHDIWLLYGNATATAFPVVDDYKPLIDLANSRNNSWVWSTFNYTKIAKPGTWSPAILSSISDGLLQAGQTPVSRLYRGNQIVFADPSTELGAVMATVNYLNVEKPETATMQWSFYHPAGFTTTSFAGNKYTQNSGSWPAIAGLWKSTDGINWTQVWNEAIPGNIAAWTNTFTHNSVSLSGTYQYLKILFQGSIPAKAGNYAAIQCDTVTLALGTGIITVSMSSELTNYQFTATVTNNTSGESLYINVTAVNASTLTIDCGAKTATLSDGTNVFSGISLSPNRVNPAWLNIGQDSNQKFTGAAQLVYTEPGVASETLNYSWRDSGE